MKKRIGWTLFVVFLFLCVIWVKSCIDNENVQRKKELARSITFTEAASLAHSINTKRGKELFYLTKDVEPKHLVGMSVEHMLLLTKNMWINDDDILRASVKVGAWRLYTYTPWQQEFPYVVFQDKDGKSFFMWIALDCASTERFYKEPVVSWRAGDKVLLVFNMNESKRAPVDKLNLPEGMPTCEYEEG